VRVSTAFNRMLELPGAWVQDVAFSGEGVIVTVGLRRRAPVCSGCGAHGLEIKDRRVKRWRHLDLGSCRCLIECELGRLRCPCDASRSRSHSSPSTTPTTPSTTVGMSPQQLNTSVHGCARVRGCAMSQELAALSTRGGDTA
jgi:transposase